MSAHCCVDSSIQFNIVDWSGNVLEEDESEDDVLVLHCVHSVAELVGGKPQLGFETDGGRGMLA